MQRILYGFFSMLNYPIAESTPQNEFANAVVAAGKPKPHFSVCSKRYIEGFTAHRSAASTCLMAEYLALCARRVVSAHPNLLAFAPCVSAFSNLSAPYQSPSSRSHHCFPIRLIFLLHILLCLILRLRLHLCHHLPLHLPLHLCFYAVFILAFVQAFVFSAVLFSMVLCLLVWCAILAPIF